MSVSPWLNIFLEQHVDKQTATVKNLAIVYRYVFQKNDLCKRAHRALTDYTNFCPQKFPDLIRTYELPSHETTVLSF